MTSLQPARRVGLGRGLGRAAVRGQGAVTTGYATTGHPSIVDRLRNEVLQYEASHPSLAAGLGRIIDALAGMGI